MAKARFWDNGNGGNDKWLSPQPLDSETYPGHSVFFLKKRSFCSFSQVFDVKIPWFQTREGKHREPSFLLAGFAISRYIFLTKICGKTECWWFYSAYPCARAYLVADQWLHPVHLSAKCRWQKQKVQTRKGMMDFHVRWLFSINPRPKVFQQRPLQQSEQDGRCTGVSDGGLPF